MNKPIKVNYIMIVYNSIRDSHRRSFNAVGLDGLFLCSLNLILRELI